ncbi:hypothetical protein [Halochromatium salexigens]|uniref:hypothetical protein n=1 Tax=Halochromatium salexigens TaxID=49447 RepID=UPI001912AED2|nr:hypothetical protein [Halochromatium salexigens]
MNQGPHLSGLHQSVSTLYEALEQIWREWGQAVPITEYARGKMPITGVHVLVQVPGNAPIKLKTFDTTVLHRSFSDDRERRCVKYLCETVHALDHLSTLDDGNIANEHWQELCHAHEIVLAAVMHNIKAAENAAKKMAELRHKDNHADRAFIQQWYRENRATYEKELGGKGGKDAAATDAKEQRLVGQGWRTIRGYLNNV